MSDQYRAVVRLLRLMEKYTAIKHDLDDMTEAEFQQGNTDDDGTAMMEHLAAQKESVESDARQITATCLLGARFQSRFSACG